MSVPGKDWRGMDKFRIFDMERQGVAHTGRVVPGGDSPGRARQGRDWLGSAWRGKISSWIGLARPGGARSGIAWRGSAMRGLAWLTMARQGYFF